MKKPFDGTPKEIEDAVLNENPKRIPKEYSRELWGLCRQMLDKDPEDRIQLSEILKMQCVISSAKSQLSAELFNAEFTNYDPSKPMPMPKAMPKPV